MWLRRSARGRGVAAADDWPRAAPRVDVVNKKLWLRNVEMQLFKAVEDSELMAQRARRH
jgi:hypothetical protein